MNKNILIVIVLVVLGGVGYLAYKQETEETKAIASDLKNCTYRIEGKNITLKDGRAEEEIAPGSASKIVTQYFGNEVKHDFNGDGREDNTFLLTQETGGSGSFYYVVTALNTPDGCVGSEGFLLGDRIAPQTTEMGKGNIVVVNYADRAPGENFTVPPSVGKSIWLLLDPKTMQFGEVEKNFEGEADPEKMTLGMKTWDWIHTAYSNDVEVKPRTEKKFSLAFRDDGSFSVTTDCNSGGGKYSVTGNKITFSDIFATKMYCEGAQESDFIKMLEETQSFLFTSKGELVLGLKQGGGSVVFR